MMFEPAITWKRCLHLPLPLAVLSLLMTSALAIAPTKAIGTEKPNVVLIIVEDLNDWGGCLGGLEIGRRGARRAVGTLRPGRGSD